MLKTRCMLPAFWLSLMASIAVSSPVLAQPQQAYPRVRQARSHKGDVVKGYFSQKKLVYPPGALFLRVFKEDRALEVWAASASGEDYVLVKTYPICASSGTLGPKQTQGDRQVPEGFYRVVSFNPASSYHLSFRIDYPNAADRARGRPPLGGDIFIHGDCVTIGCIPITDEGIEELYLMVLDTYQKQKNIPVHIFPSRMTADRLEKWRADGAEWYPFWENLAEGYRYFEEHHRPPKVTVDKAGRYVFR